MQSEILNLKIKFIEFGILKFKNYKQNFKNFIVIDLKFDLFEILIDLKKHKNKTKSATTYFPDIRVTESIISHDELSFLVRYGARRFLICIVTDSVKKGNFVSLLF